MKFIKRWLGKNRKRFGMNVLKTVFVTDGFASMAGKIGKIFQWEKFLISLMEGEAVFRMFMADKILVFWGEKDGK